MLVSKWGECVQGLTYIFPKQTVPVLNHPHPEEALFCNMTGFPFLGLSTVASCVCPILSMGNAISSRRQSSAHELELPSCISCLSTCKDIQVTVLPRLNLSSLLLLLLRRNKWITCRNSAACLCTRFLYLFIMEAKAWNRSQGHFCLSQQVHHLSKVSQQCLCQFWRTLETVLLLLLTSIETMGAQHFPQCSRFCVSIGYLWMKMSLAEKEMSD